MKLFPECRDCRFLIIHCDQNYPNKRYEEEFECEKEDCLFRLIEKQEERDED